MVEPVIPNRAGASPATMSEAWNEPLEGLDVSRADLFERDVIGEYFRRLRSEDPVHYTPESEFGAYWSVTRAEDIMAVDRNHRVFSSFRDIVIGDGEEEFYTPMFIASDPPIHDIQRKAVTPAVGPRRLSDLEALIRQRVNNILDDVPLGEQINWVEHVSIELTTQMLATLFDFPFEDRHLLPKWSDAATTSPAVGVPGSDYETRHAILTECLEYFARLFQERAAQEQKFDFISLLAHDSETKNMLENPMEFLGNLILLIVGGNDTTRNSISGGVVALNQYPDEWRKVDEDRSLIPNMVSEIIRWQTPLAHMRRTALEDFELQGKQIKEGDRVVMWYLSGNRDEELFEDADRLIVDRPNARRHLSFGFGIHRCMGNRVAEMQLRILWEEILQRYRHIELVGEPVRVPSNFVRGFTEVPVVVHAR